MGLPFLYGDVLDQSWLSIMVNQTSLELDILMTNNFSSECKLLNPNYVMFQISL